MELYLFFFLKAILRYYIPPSTAFGVYRYGYPSFLFFFCFSSIFFCLIFLLYWICIYLESLGVYFVGSGWIDFNILFTMCFETVLFEYIVWFCLGLLNLYKFLSLETGKVLCGYFFYIFPCILVFLWFQRSFLLLFSFTSVYICIHNLSFSLTSFLVMEVIVSLSSVSLIRSSSC